MSPAEQTPEELAAKVADTRERLAQTIDQLVYRAQPKTILRRQLNAVAQSFYKDDGTLDPVRVGKLVGVVAGFVALVVVIRRVVG